MLITEVTNRNEFNSLVVGELRELYGIKYRKDKKSRSGQDKRNGKLFGVPLSKLELTDVILANGGIVQVPQFVADACQLILDNVKTEGLFRKAGSAARQRDIKAYLETGQRLGKSYNVIDVANILKCFFRELPEAILPIGNIQEAILRCLLCGEKKVNALLTACLLLSPLSLNTLAFFMQFLNTVSLHAHINKMSIENLAIIFAPGLMPLTEIIGKRLTCHVNVIQTYIENAFDIGIIPKSIIDRSELANVKKQQTTHPETEKKKKKRRSGSLTRMFNGLRKIVLGSSESLDRTPEAEPCQEQALTTPCISKSAKKRKVAELNTFSARKKKEVLSSMPEDTVAILPNSPMHAKENKRSRLSLGGKRNGRPSTFLSSISVPPPIERRWSIVGVGWNKKKTEVLNQVQPKSQLSPVVSLPCLQTITNTRTNQNDILEISTNHQESTSDDSCDYLRIPKGEFEAIKNRVSAIENRISQEFTNLHTSMVSENVHEMNPLMMDGPEMVLDKYERTLENTEELADTSSTDQLAKRLSRELNIRRSAKDKIMRSPSARKISTIRRRSRENVRLSRNLSWHLGNKVTTECVNKVTTNCANEVSTECVNKVPSTECNTEEVNCLKSNLKRGRPNTVQSGLRHPSPNIKLFNHELISPEMTNPSDDIRNERWINAEQFFKDSPAINNSIQKKVMSAQVIEEPPCTPRFVSTVTLGEMKTPMLPPRLPVKKTPVTNKRNPMLSEMSSAHLINKTLLTPLQEQQTGRASIARLRSQNAGMVAAKAKLFGGMVTDNGNSKYHLDKTGRSINGPIKAGKSNENQPAPLHKFKNRQGKKLVDSPKKSTPNRKSANGIQRRQKLRLGKSPKRSPLKNISKRTKTPRSLMTDMSNSSLINIHLCKDSERNTPNVEILSNNDDMRYDATPHIKRPLMIKSPRRLLKTPHRDLSRKSPMRATPMKVRSSPRLQG